MGGQATAKLRSQDAEESKGMGGKALCGGEASGAKVLRHEGSELFTWVCAQWCPALW